MASTVTAQYAAGVAAGRVGSDDAQFAVIAQLQRLEVGSPNIDWRAILVARLAVVTQGAPIKGLYIHGDVGRGKTMLMDLFLRSKPVTRKPAPISRIHLDGTSAFSHCARR